MRKLGIRKIDVLVEVSVVGLSTAFDSFDKQESFSRAVHDTAKGALGEGDQEKQIGVMLVDAYKSYPMERIVKVTIYAEDRLMYCDKQVDLMDAMESLVGDMMPGVHLYVSVQNPLYS